MLSRVAESMFWMSRYVERAENVARFIDVNCNLMLDSTVMQQEQWLALVDTTGDRDTFSKKHVTATSADVIDFLAFDPTNLNSIVSCVRAARENARTIRDVISSEMWEQINTFYLMINDPGAKARAIESPYEFFNQVKTAAYLIIGVTDNTMSNSEGWNFCRLGRFIERADKTSRIVDVKYYMLLAPAALGQAQDDIQWGAVLKSASALEMFRKKHRRIQPAKVIEFLLLDEEFPRSIRFCLRTARNAVQAITAHNRSGSALRAEEFINSIFEELSATSVETVLQSGLHEYLDELQTNLNKSGEAIHQAFFGAASSEAGQEQRQS
jgi:uncharacterized alpha-E superfamily protein